MTDSRNKRSLRTLLLPAAAAAVLFVPLFALRHLGPIDFWWWMSGNAVVVVLLSFFFDPSYGKFLKKDLAADVVRKIAIGVVSAVVLYGVFFIGNRLSPLILTSAREDISGVYAFKEGASVWRIALLMIVLIGPGEELFWRGFLQRIGENRFGVLPAYVLSALAYALVHLSSGNVILVLSAVICGLFWGGLYIRFRSVLILMISHTLWDLMIFLAWTLD